MTGLMDCHMHSHCSSDGQETTADLCSKSFALGLAGIAITDHCDLLEWHKDGYAREVHRSLRESESLAQQWQGRLTVLKGVELGDAALRPELARQLLSSCDYDFVLASAHWDASGMDIYYADFTQWSPQSIHDYLDWYFHCLLTLSRSPFCDSLAHLTYPLRYITGSCGIPVDLSPFLSLIDETLRILAGEGKALEVNTAGLRQPIGETAPPLWILERFRQLGGAFVTIGSDAHRLDHIGAGIDAAAAMLKQTGFSHYAFFRQRKPVLVPLPPNLPQLQL